MARFWCLVNDKCNSIDIRFENFRLAIHLASTANGVCCGLRNECGQSAGIQKEVDVVRFAHLPFLCGHCYWQGYDYPARTEKANLQRPCRCIFSSYPTPTKRHITSPLPIHLEALRYTVLAAKVLRLHD